MLTIGEFSRICFVSKKTLRHYDEIGLFRPEYIAENGYRYYGAGQLRTMLLIARLKDYGFSLPEIAAVLACDAPEYLREKLGEKRARMQEEARRKEQALRRLELDMDKLQRGMDIMEQNIVVKTVEYPKESILGLRRRINVRDFQAFFGEFFKLLGERNLAGVAGPPMAFYHEEDFNPESSDIEIACAVPEGTEGAHTHGGGLHCVTTLLGAYSDEAFRGAYAGLAKWTEENGYRISGAPFDKYVVGGEEAAPEDYVTEIYMPIAKA